MTIIRYLFCPYRRVIILLNVDARASLLSILNKRSHRTVNMRNTASHPWFYQTTPRTHWFPFLKRHCCFLPSKTKMSPSFAAVYRAFLSDSTSSLVNFDTLLLSVLFWYQLGLWIMCRHRSHSAGLFPEKQLGHTHTIHSHWAIYIIEHKHILQTALWVTVYMYAWDETFESTDNLNAIANKCQHGEHDSH